MLVVGTHVSPYARKVLVALDIKGLDYEVDPIVPFFGGDEFSRISPLRRIPVLIDGDLVLNDSTVICEYLDERFPDPPLMPKTPADRARARWLEEYADSRLGDVVIWRFFFEKLVAPRIFKRDPDEPRIAASVGRELPAALDWIEAQAPADGFLFDHLCTVDITYTGFFRNAALAGFTIDPDHWPRTAAWVARVEAVPAFARSIACEQAMMRVPPTERGAALRALGIRVAERSVGTREPRPSIMLAQS